MRAKVMTLSVMIIAALAMVFGAGAAEAKVPHSNQAPPPVCYYKKYVQDTDLGRMTTINRVDRPVQYFSIPARTKRCHVVQTYVINHRFGIDPHRTGFVGWINVKY